MDKNSSQNHRILRLTSGSGAMIADKGEKFMRLLIAEDERSLSRAVKTILEHEHYTVDAAYDGEEALEYLSTGDYDGVILDVMMPKMDGITVLTRLRESGNQIPVLMLTAKAEIDDRVLGLDSGANDYLTKPFATKELLVRIHAMTRVAALQDGAKLSAGNILLDRATFTLSSPTGSFRLANREFQMLELLMCSPGQSIKSGRLYEKIWKQEEQEEDDPAGVNFVSN